MKNYLKSIYSPKFFHLFNKGRYDKSRFMSDLIAGIIVGIIALPLAIAFGIASGATPQQGLITAIIAGFLISFLGGTRFLIGGPTGAFIVIVAGIIAQYGTDGLILATMMAGVILIVMGVTKIGVIFKFIPYPIIVGFTSGIAVTIFSTQMLDFFGFLYQDGAIVKEAIPAAFIPKWGWYFSHLSNISWTETALSVFCLALIIVWGKFFKKVPGSLIAIIAGTAIALLCKHLGWCEFATIGDKFPEMANGMSFPAPKFPSITWDMARGLLSPAFTIAILCAIESLLAAMVTDGVTGKQHDANTELIGEGIANFITPLFGGIPATGAIARTMANINNGGKTPVAGIIHAIVLLMIFLFLMPYAIHIPLAALAAILVMVAYNMSEWRTFKYLLKGDRGSIAVLLLTFFLTVLIDLTVAIEVGVVLAIVLFVKRVMETSEIKALEGSLAASEDDEIASMDDIEMLQVPNGVEVYEVNGPFFFGMAAKMEEFDQRKNEVSLVRIIRMRKVPFIDSTGVHNLSSLVDRTQKRGIRVILSGVQPGVLDTLKKFGLDKEIGEEYIFPHIIPALAKAKEIVETKGAETNA